MWKPSEIKKEIIALEWIIKWLKTRTAKGICLFAIVILVIFLVKDFQSYSKKQNQAFRIYPEILANVNELDVFIKKWAGPSGITLAFSRPKSYLEDVQLAFKYEFYDKFYDGFSKPSIDLQISNFYINLKKYKPVYLAKNLIPLQNQGSDVIKKMNYYFGCKDFFQKGNKTHNIISADASVPTFSVVRYLRYKFR